MIFNKKGVVDILIAFGIVILFIAGTIIVAREYDIKYIGNKETKNLYELKDCPSIFEDIRRENLETFSSLKDAENKGYKLVNGCQNE